MAGADNYFMGNLSRADWPYRKFDPFLHCEVPAGHGRGRIFPWRDCLPEPLVSLPGPCQNGGDVYGWASHLKHPWRAALGFNTGCKLVWLGRLALGFYFGGNTGRNSW